MERCTDGLMGSMVYGPCWDPEISKKGSAGCSGAQVTAMSGPLYHREPRLWGAHGLSGSWQWIQMLVHETLNKEGHNN
jgi:hypothetical protein